MGMLTEVSREFWRGVLVGGGFTAIPRWTLDPVAGVAEHEATIPGDLAAALRRLADELAVPLSSVLLTAHAKVLAALSGEPEVVTGYVAADGGRPLPCRLTTKPDSWRTVLLDTHRVESELLSHKDFPVDDLRRELGLTEPSFETVFDPAGGDGDLAEDTVLWVGISQHRRAARAAVAVPDRRARRRLRRQDRRLSPHRARADRRRSGCRARAAEPAFGRGTPLPARRARRTPPGAAGPPAPRAVRAAGGSPPGRRRGRARRPAVDLPGAQRPRQPAGTSPAGAGAAPRRCRRGGDRAQPGLDGRRPRGLQGRWRVPAHRAAFPGRPHRDRAFPCRVRARADRARQHHHAGRGPRLAARSPDALRRRGLRGAPCRRESRRRRRAGPARLHPLHLRLHRRAQGRDVRARGHAQPHLRQDRRPGGRRGAGGPPDRTPVLRHLGVATGCRAPGRRADPAGRAGGDPGRPAVRRHDRRRPGRRAPGRAVVPRSRPVLPGAAPPRAAGPALRVAHRRFR